MKKENYISKALGIKEQATKEIIEIINAYGNDGSLPLFDLCSECGIEFNYSTLDCIYVVGETNVMVVFNENTNDEELLEFYNLEDICQLCDDLNKHKNFFAK